MNRLTAASLFLILSGYTSTLLAGGFQLWPQDAKNVGTFGAGAAAIADDASTTFYNPAGLTRIKRQDAIFSMMSRIDSTKYKGVTMLNPSIPDFTQNAGTAQGGDLRWLPTLLYAAPIGKKWGFGLSFTSPFDLDVNYGTDAFTRYTVTRHDIELYNFSSALGYRILPTLSIGAGLNAEHIEIQFNQVNNDTVSIANDQLAKNNLTDWSAGWNAGILWEPSEKTRLGLHYVSQIVHQAAGESRSGNNYSRVRTRFTTPPSTTFSFLQTLIPTVDIIGTASFIEWHTFENFTLRNSMTPDGPQTIILQNNLRNTWLFSIGSRYRLTSNFTLRGALGYDQGAMKQDEQGLTIPDSDRYIASLGLGYQINQSFGFDLGYLHSFSTRAHVNETQNSGTSNLTNIGNFDLASDMIGLQMDWLMT